MLSVVLATLGGLIYGSFLNVLLWRLPEEKSIGGRSQCRSCNHTLSWYDLIPVFSFIILRGRCRYCHARIHPRYPVVEIATGLALGAYFLIQHPLLNLEIIITIGGILILTSLFFFDLFYLILPDVIVIPAVIAYAIFDVFRPSPAPYFILALLLTLFFAILYGVSRGTQLGFGDVKLSLLIGLMLGYPLGFISVVGGIWLGALVGLGLLATGKSTRKDPLPLGAFLCFTALACLIFSHEILHLAASFF